MSVSIGISIYTYLYLIGVPCGPCVYQGPPRAPTPRRGNTEPGSSQLTLCVVPWGRGQSPAALRSDWTSSWGAESVLRSREGG